MPAGVRISSAQRSIVLLAFAFVLTGCAGRPTPVRDAVMGGAKVTQESAAPRPQVSLPQTVYVADFQLDVQAQEAGGDRPRLLHLPAGAQGPAEQAARIVGLTAESLTNDLVRAGVPAQRLPSGVALPASGWLVRGVFTEASEGSTIRRAVVGFGAGAPRMEVQVGVSDLADQPAAPFAILGTATDPDRLPGGLLSRNPYVIAAKFVLEKGAPGRDVKATAQAIADRIVELRNKVRQRDGISRR
jgi:predicted small secreted protein